jgi:serine/threonine protein kinase
MMLTLENWSTLLVRSRLHSPENARSLCERWRSEAGTAAEPRDFVRWLLTHGHLTQYQARLLSQGRVEGLFLGPYKLLERINQGRMAGAFQAIHETSLEPAVIKVLPAERAKDPLLLARFQREAKLATQLAHPSIVRVLQTGEAGGLHYVALEPVEGATL